MAKKGFLSWLGLGKKQDQTAESHPQQAEPQEVQQKAVQQAQQNVQEAPVHKDTVHKEPVHEDIKQEQAVPEQQEVKTDASVEQDHDITPENKQEQPSEKEAEKTDECAQSGGSEEPEAAFVAEQAQGAASSSDLDTPVTTERVAESITQPEPEPAPAPAPNPAPGVEMAAEAAAEAVVETKVEPAPKKSFFSRLKQGLQRTKANLGSGIFSLFKGKKIDDELFEELEEQLLVADLGVETTTRIIDELTESSSRQQLKDAEALYEQLKANMRTILDKVEAPLLIDTSKKPYVILMVGVNGVGKTTTIGKMAKQFQADGKSVMLAAGDTFRAAAVEQLEVWGERNNIPVVAQHTGADSASVLYDALEAAKARNVDVLIADTAGRLQSKNNLMEELKKVVRVLKKLEPEAPHEIMLTIDAGTGQNAISQAKLFDEAVGLTGITLTKLDGTAKGGVIFSVADKFGIPIRYVGVGEGIDDLRAFKAGEFIDALFSRDDNQG